MKNAVGTSLERFEGKYTKDVTYFNGMTHWTKIGSYTYQGREINGYNAIWFGNGR